MTPQSVNIQVNPIITADTLFDFYERNDICEVGFDKEVTARILEHLYLIVAAYGDTELFGLVRVTFDRLFEHILEFKVYKETRTYAFPP